MKEKRIILVRHGKSSWEFDLPDFDRPLKKRGISDANIIAGNFKKYNYKVDKVFSSSANRAFTTCKIFQKTLGWSNTIIEKHYTLYDFAGEKLIKFISKTDNELDTVVIFGHNYAFTSIANLYGDSFIDNVPTSGLVVLKFNLLSWEYVKHGQTELIMFPRDYRI